MNKNYVGENIKIYRERKNITQRELGDKIGKTWEMISRYERGVSSPLNQLNVLAEALEVDVTDLMKDPLNNLSNTHSFNRIPLFASLPKDLNFKGVKTYLYYVAPDWVLDIDLESFVIATELVSTNIADFKKKGYLYISPNSKCSKNDLVLKKENGNIVIDDENRFNNENIIGKILAQEVIF